MDGQRAPVTPTADTKQTRTPEKTSVLGMYPLSTFADPVASYLTAGGAWPNMPPTLRSILLMQQTVGNRAVAQYLETGCQLNEPAEKRKAEPNVMREQDPDEEPVDREEKSNLSDLQPKTNGNQLKQINGDGVVSTLRATTSGPSRKSALRWGSAVSSSPIAVSWAALQSMSASGPAFGDKISGPPAGTDLLTIEGHGGTGARGWTYRPTNYKAPNFKFNSTNKGTTGTPKWWASPTSSVTTFEGDANAYYPTAGIHKVGQMEGGKNTYRDVSTAISDLIKVGEQEHCDDHAEAYRISLKEAEEVLTTKIYGKDFGPKPNKAQAEQMVLDTIKSNLTHSALGEDKTKWAATYATLIAKTSTRDTSGWHTIARGTRRTNAAGDVIYDLVTDTTTKIGTVPSSSVVKY